MKATERTPRPAVEYAKCATCHERIGRHLEPGWSKAWWHVVAQRGGRPHIAKPA